MTGPEHYREAERLLAERVFVTRHGTEERSFGETVAAAQVHATLALAAASGVKSPADDRAWADVAGTRLSDS